MARVHVGVHWGGGTPGIRTNEGVHKAEIGMKLHEFVRNWYEIRVNFVLICVNSRL